MTRQPWQLALLYAAAALLALFVLAPLAWLLVMSVSAPVDLVAIPLRWLPASMDFSRYRDLLGLGGGPGNGLFLAALRNSVLTAGGAVLVTIVIAIPAAYGFARRGAPSALMFAMLATFMVPPIVYVLPIYAGLGTLHLLNTSTGLGIVYVAYLLPFAVWLTRASVEGLPLATEEAAMLDGCSTFEVIWHIVVPTARPALVAVAMLSFLNAWDEFFYALILTSDQQAKTLPVAIADFASGRATDYGLVSAVGVLAAIPPVVLAVLFQRSLIAGLSAGSVKG